jgi:hypothetical protein
VIVVVSPATVDKIFAAVTADTSRISSPKPATYTRYEEDNWRFIGS